MSEPGLKTVVRQADDRRLVRHWTGQHIQFRNGAGSNGSCPRKKIRQSLEVMAAVMATVMPPPQIADDETKSFLD
jgi:hypothetical protein